MKKKEMLGWLNSAPDATSLHIEVARAGFFGVITPVRL